MNVRSALIRLGATLGAILLALGLSAIVLLVIDRADDVAALSARNLPAVHTLYADQLNTYDVLVSDDVVFTQAAYEAYVAQASGAKKEDAQ